MTTIEARMRGGIVFVLAVGFVAAGCGKKSTASNRTTMSVPKPCLPGTASPISESTLVSTFRAQGIELSRDATRRHCAPDALSTLSNTGDIPYEEQVRVREAEGDIFCDVYPTELWGAQIERFVWRNDPDPIHINVLNVSCSHYPESAVQTDRLEQAFRKLPGVSSRPTTVPSSDAVHD